MNSERLLNPTPLMKLPLFAIATLLTFTAQAEVAFRIEKDITYLAPERKEKADLYLPGSNPSGARRPAVVIIHGGGWTGGDKHSFGSIKQYLDAGISVVSINYRYTSQAQDVAPPVKAPL